MTNKAQVIQLPNQIFPSEFKPKNDEKEKIAEQVLGFRGKCLGSKTGYRYFNPLNLITYNSNVCVETGKIWHGDLDISIKINELKTLSKQLGETVYVLQEMDGRFENAESPRLERAVVIVKDGEIELGKFFKEYYEIIDGKAIKEKYKDLFLEKDFLKPISFKVLKLASNKKDVSPVEKLYKQLTKKLKINTKTHCLDDFRVFLNEDDYNVLAWLTKNWLRRFHTGKENEYLTNRYFNEMTGFGIGFNSFDDKKISLFQKAGHIYVKKNAIVKKVQK
jgi:hypothetical protein